LKTTARRVSSQISLVGGSREDMLAYVKSGIELNAKLGLDAFDIDTELILRFDDIERGVDEIKTAAYRHGKRFELCHLPFGITPATFDERIESFTVKMHRAIDAAAQLGVDFAVLHPLGATVPAEEYDAEADRSKCLRFLEPFAEHAVKVGLNICVENMRLVKPSEFEPRRYGAAVEEVCELADTLGAGICWDFGHANITGLKQSEALEYVGGRLKMLHINDNFGLGDIHLAPFMGNIDWADAMHGVAMSGFTGLINYEVSAKRMPADLREVFGRYLTDAAQKLIDLIV